MLSYSAKLVYAHDLLAAQQNLYIFNVLTLFCSFLAVWQLFARCSARVSSFSPFGNPWTLFLIP